MGQPGSDALPWWYDPAIAAHIALAVLALAAALVAICADKRGRVHRRAGAIWVYGMNAAVLLALPALAVRLHGVGIASGVMIIYLSYRGTHSYRRPRSRWVDRAIFAFYLAWLALSVALMDTVRAAPDTLAWTQIFLAGLLIAEIRRPKHRARRADKTRSHIWSMVLSVSVSLEMMAASNWPFIGQLAEADLYALTATLAFTVITLALSLRRYPLPAHPAPSDRAGALVTAAAAQVVAAPPSGDAG